MVPNSHDNIFCIDDATKCFDDTTKYYQLRIEQENFEMCSVIAPEDIIEKKVETVTTSSIDKNILNLKIKYNETSEKDFYMSDHFKQLPWGLINKSITGLGATSLELKTERNSIIVTPTKSLAYGKWVKDEDNYLYVGSSYGKIKTNIDFPAVVYYLENDNIRYKKILVVADSLKKVISALEECDSDYKNNYFIMIDEVDKFIKDTSYRYKLEDAIDIYFEFNSKKRAMITATISDFSNPDILKEEITEFKFQQPLRDINVIATNNALFECVEKINKILDENESDKIFIAINSIGIPEKIISELGKTRKITALVGIAGGDNNKKNKNYVNLHEDYQGNELPKQIVFTTSTNFVGIDLYDSYHLIIVSTIQKEHHMISASDLIQIYGRNRKKQGILSDTFIFESKDIKKNILDDNSELDNIGMNPTRDEEISYANKLVKYIDLFKQLRSTIFKATNNNDIKNALQTIDNDKLYVRLDNKQNCVISYFNIDAAMEKYYLENVIYRRKDEVENMLRSDRFNFKPFEIEIKLNNNNLNKEDLERIKIEKKARQKASYLEVIDRIENTSNMAYRSLKKIINSSGSKDEKNIIAKYDELRKYINKISIIKILREFVEEEGTETNYYKYYNSVILESLSSKDSFKTYINTHLKVGRTYNSSVVKNTIINALNMDSLRLKNPDNDWKKFLKSIIKIKEINRGRSNERIEIISYNQFDVTKLKTINREQAIIENEHSLHRDILWKGNFFETVTRLQVRLTGEFF